MALIGQPRAYLGIDIGTSAIKLVELLGRESRCELVTYAYADLSNPRHWRASGIFDQAAVPATAAIIKNMLEQAEASADHVIFSLPAGHLFSQVVRFPKMADRDLWPAVLFKAESIVPLSLDEVVIAVTKPGETKQVFSLTDQIQDLAAIKKSAEPTQPDSEGFIDVLLTVVPKRVIAWYQSVAQLSGLTMVAAESEVFPLMRAHHPLGKTPIMFCSVGWGETSFYVVSRDEVRFARTIDFSYRDRQTQTNYDLLASEAKRVADQYVRASSVGLLRIILSGGGTLDQRVRDTLIRVLGPNVTISNPFRGLYCPPGLEQKLTALAPLFVMAVGAARREIVEEV